MHLSALEREKLMSFTRINIRSLLAVVILIGVGLSGSFSSKSLAQDTPTDRPFPVSGNQRADG